MAADKLEQTIKYCEDNHKTELVFFTENLTTELVNLAASYFNGEKAGLERWGASWLLF